MKKEYCNLKSCQKEIVGYAYINTALGEFCSEECRTEVENNIFRLLMNLPEPSRTLSTLDE